MELTGRSLVAGKRVTGEGARWKAIDPRSGSAIEPEFHAADASTVDRAVQEAEKSFADFGRSDGDLRGALLRSVAEEIEARLPLLEERVPRETGLPAQRVQGETGRTCGQLRMFADLVEEGSWVDARIDTAQPDRNPIPKPDLRSMLRPLGPVVVFGASNFPLAFSVAGGDTASALASGNPVIVKAHPAHPGTSEIVADAVSAAVEGCGLPAGVFSLLFDDGFAIGASLVQHPGVRAVGFTGSRAGGRALMDLAARRNEPIPVFAEMGSINPVFVLQGALDEGGSTIAGELAGSVGLANGQFCTCPGLIVVPDGEAADSFVRELRTALGGEAVPMLNAGICETYGHSLRALVENGAVEVDGSRDPKSQGTHARSAVLRTDAATFLQNPELAREVFGPATLVVTTRSADERRRVAERFEGQLTATVRASEGDRNEAGALLRLLEQKAGRLLYGGVPTGVEVCPSMVHGGPYPATSDSRSTSVGTAAIHRFTRAVSYQNHPDELLPPELRRGNPKGIWRLVNGERTRD